MNIEKAAKRLAKDIERSGDGFDIGTVIQFDMRYNEGGVVYNYAAIKAADGKWYMTGRVQSGITYERLVQDFLSKAEYVGVAGEEQFLAVDF